MPFALITSSGSPAVLNFWKVVEPFGSVIVVVLIAFGFAVDEFEHPFHRVGLFFDPVFFVVFGFGDAAAAVGHFGHLVGGVVFEFPARAFFARQRHRGQVARFVGVFDFVAHRVGDARYLAPCIAEEQVLFFSFSYEVPMISDSLPGCRRRRGRCRCGLFVR